MVSSRKILMGVCGGIAAYKACELVRLFVKNGNTVQVMMSKAAQQFVTPLTFQALTNQSVATEMFDLTQENEIGHIQLADSPDVIVIAPATADVIAKAAHGICDDLITTVLLATKKPVVFAPSMNVNMFENPITQKNIQTLKECKHHFVDPEEGELACGWQGAGRLANPETIFSYVKNLITSS